ncbi:hypothetical protein PC9H_011541 [Pleurotus ostreatus]|uniref:alpha-1,6-mannosyl-glycoprotein 6-beta-N-acetylglucosaminyltransferase n=1 Tax=Pleurotus ostreatus TaxID=5322 RepID=A0A8H6ZMY7_PLEOS|nr:uncharacterized protein PC9H_011541 [Pleurotus ostreatus]KAF7421022.1 hypothetical protein PC9H_011541 [Pleurotus ostreatus]
MDHTMHWRGEHEHEPEGNEENDPAYELLLPGEHTNTYRDRPKRPPWYKRSAYILLCAAALLFISTVLYTIDVFSGYSLRKTLSSASSNYVGSVVSHLWPEGMANRTDNWENENSKTMHALFKCLANGGCGENQTSIVLLSSPHFKDSIAGHTSGEDIWAISILLSLKEMGYTAVYAPHNSELLRTYRQYPDLVKIIISEGSDAESCFKDPQCTKTKDHPLGIPAWKMLAMHFWTGSSHPLGNQWTLSPENFPLLSPGNSKDNVYLGYSVERACKEIPIMPMDERPNQGFVYGKRLDYFFGKDFAWEGVSFVPPFPIQLVAGFSNDSSVLSPPPEGIDNMGVMPKHRFYEHLGMSRVLIGIGRPVLSPTPYDALCMGVPFINPIMHWDKKKPDDRSKWEAQHDGLKYESPPYVYNVKKGDGEGLWKAVKDALDHPIDRYIVPNMTMASLGARLGALVEKDWKSQAEQLLELRKKTGKGEVSRV